MKECLDEYSGEESDKMFKESTQIKISNKGESTTNWYDKNKFKKILTTTDSNNFNHKNKIGKFKFNDINNLINNIKNNAISEADTKKKINELNERKNVETKGKRLIKSQEKLLSLFDNLKTIFNNSNNNNNNNNSNNNNKESNNKNESKHENENENENEMKVKMRKMNITIK